MFRNLIVVWVGVVSVFSLILFSDVSASASDNNSDVQKTSSAEIVKFSITPATLRMFPGGSMQPIAEAYDSNGKKIIIAPEWRIKSDVSSLGEFDKLEGDKVIFSALNSGSGSIIAVYHDVEAEVHVEIYKRKKK